MNNQVGTAPQATPQEAQRKLNATSMALLLVGGIWTLLSVWSLLNQFSLQGQIALAQIGEAWGPISSLLALVGLAAGALVLWGGLQMRRTQSYGAAKLAAILAIVPGLLSLWPAPFGIWAFVVLNKPEVKALFPNQQ